MVVVSVEPQFRFMERAGVATGTRDTGQWIAGAFQHTTAWVLTRNAPALFLELGLSPVWR